MLGKRSRVKLRTPLVSAAVPLSLSPPCSVYAPLRAQAASITALHILLQHSLLYCFLPPPPMACGGGGGKEEGSHNETKLY